MNTSLLFPFVLGLLSKLHTRAAVYPLQMSTYWFVLEGPICSTPVKDVDLKTGKGHMDCSNTSEAALLALALAVVTELLSLVSGRQSSSKKEGLFKMLIKALVLHHHHLAENNVWINPSPSKSLKKQNLNSFCQGQMSIIRKKIYMKF